MAGQLLVLGFVLSICGVMRAQRDYSCPPEPRISQAPFPVYKSTCDTGPTINPNPCFPGFQFGFADFTELDVSKGFSMAIRLDQKIIGWGSFPQDTVAVSEQFAFHGISGGDTFACGFETSTMQSICWGSGDVVDNNPCLPIFRLDASDLFVCALSFNPRNVNVTGLSLFSNQCHELYATAASLRASCWGTDPETGAFNLPQIQNVAAFDPCVGGSFSTLDPLFGITVGKNFACVRTFFGKVACSGIFAAGNRAENYVQTKAFSAISAGNLHFCGTLLFSPDAGKIECAGVGPPSLMNPPNVRLKLTDSAIASGSQISCGIRADNEEAICWGATQQFFLVPMPTGVQYTQIVGGTQSQHFCARRKSDGFIDCWGACEFDECTPPTELLAVNCRLVSYVGNGNCYNTSPQPPLGGLVACESRACSSGMKYEIDFGGDCLCGGVEKDRLVYDQTVSGVDYCTEEKQIHLQKISCRL